MSDITTAGKFASNSDTERLDMLDKNVCL